MVVQQDLEKVGRTVYGSRDTIVKKTSHLFLGLTLGAEGGGLICKLIIFSLIVRQCNAMNVIYISPY